MEPALAFCHFPSSTGFLIRGEDLVLQELSHSSIMFVHRLAVGSPLLVLHFHNILLQDGSYWTSIIDGLDPLFLKTLSLCNRSQSQFMQYKYV